jgi:hypothetical protein
MKPDIIDLDGGDAAPSRRTSMLIVSVVLVGAAVLGYAAVSSPALRGPYATPYPTAVVVPVRFTPAPFVSIQPASVGAPGGLGCVVPGSVSTTQVFVGGQLVTVTRPQPLSVSAVCQVFYRDLQRVTLPLDRIAR